MSENKISDTEALESKVISNMNAIIEIRKTAGLNSKGLVLVIDKNKVTKFHFLNGEETEKARKLEKETENKTKQTSKLVMEAYDDITTSITKKTDNSLFYASQGNYEKGLKHINMAIAILKASKSILLVNKNRKGYNSLLKGMSKIKKEIIKRKKKHVGNH